MSDKKAQVFDLLRKFAVGIGADITQERLQVYTSWVNEYSAAEIGKALKTALLDSDSEKFPSHKKLRSYFDGDEKTESGMIAGKIIESMSRFGYYQATEARRYIGEIGWKSVNMCGGWTNLCNENSPLGVIRAQVEKSTTTAYRSCQGDESKLLELKNEKDSEFINNILVLEKLNN